MAGAANRLRHDRGLSYKASYRWARVLTNQDTRCSICGVPLYWLRQQNQWKCGGEKCNRRMTIDHIEPSSPKGGYRALCFSCNRTRGANYMSDTEVLTIMRRWYRQRWNARFLFWLNTEPGKGGTLHRNERVNGKDQATAVR